MGSKEKKRTSKPTSDKPAEQDEASGLDRERLLEDAKAFRRGRKENGAADDVEEASKESFPASDPPSWTPNTGMGQTDKRK